MPYPIFLSLVYVVRNQSADIVGMLTSASQQIQALVADHEIIVVDNASSDDSLTTLRQLTSVTGLPNIQVYALTKEVDRDTASWVGLENALGDFVAVLDPCEDDIAFLPQMLEKATTGSDVVLASNELRPRHSLSYRLAYGVFNALYRSITGIHLAKDAPNYRLLSKRVVNFILQHPQPAVTYRHLPATGGFTRAHLSYRSAPRLVAKKRTLDSIDRGMKLLVSTTRAPMRLVTTLSIFGAMANLLYSFYVVAIGLFKTDVAPGWVSLSLQQSGMFFLISLVLLVLGEYILNMASLSNEGPLYHVANEFTSVTMTRHHRLNVEVSRLEDAARIRPDRYANRS